MQGGQDQRWIFHVFVIVGFIITLVLFGFAYHQTQAVKDVQTTFGVTYSWTYAQQLNLDPVETYKEIIEELEVTHVRLPLYWSEIEAKQERFDWEIADQLVEISAENNVQLTPVVGVKVPRWPECYMPDWAKTQTVVEQQNHALAFIAEAVLRYDTVPTVTRWQVENEPFFPFGECPEPDLGLFKERVDLVRTLSDKPIQVTVSGEIGPWEDAVQAADVLGLSMYRTTHNNVFGHFVYPLSPSYYYFRTELVKDRVSKVIVSELQAEPWFHAPIESRALTDWYEAFTVEMFEENIDFATDAQISEVYLWGVEWWYALKQAGDERLWKVAEKLF